MKDYYSPFLLKNTFGSKMKKGFRNFCHGVNSISTLKQKAGADISRAAARSAAGSYMDESDAAASPMTLDQMILQLDMADETSGRYRRTSCVDNSDILRSARNALSQYPRFSLDGKDAMYRSSFLNFEGGRRSSKLLERNLCLPPTVAGESVVWCEPGVVAKLMGLDALPVPVAGDRARRKRIGGSVSASRKRCVKMNIAKHELERESERLQLRLLHCRKGRVESSGSCSAAGSYYLLPGESDLR